MHVLTILHNLFGVCRSSFDKRVLKTLFSTVEALIRCRKLSIAGLGRSLNRNCFIKHKIKAVDRLFGNIKLQANSFHLYQVILNNIVCSNKNPIIIVDWSGLTPCGNYYFLRAAIPVGGRALPILEIPYQLEDYACKKTHKSFLTSLRAMLPKNCRPVILTDAGFRNPWFKLVLSFGWDYIGRVVSSTHCFPIEGDEWSPVKLLHTKAKYSAKYLGEFILAKTNPLHTNFFILKGPKKNRVKKNLIGKKIQCSVSLKHAKRESEPLLVATSLCEKNINANKIIKLYQKRMQIEEGFRDLKNERSGFSLRQNRSMSIGRLSVALLIGAIAMLILWILGIAAKNRQLHYHYQANTIRHQNVLSLFMIGWQVIEEGRIFFTKKEIKQSLKILHEAQYA